MAPGPRGAAHLRVARWAGKRRRTAGLLHMHVRTLAAPRVPFCCKLVPQGLIMN